MLLVGAVVFAVLVVRLMGLLLAPTDAVVPADDRPHLLSLPADEERMLFRPDGIAEVPACRVGPPGAEGRAPQGLRWDVRTDAEGGTWHAFGRFETGDGRLELRCSSLTPSEVRVGRPVGFQDVFGPFGSLAFVPVVLGLLGLVLVVVTAVRRSSVPRRS